MQRVAVVTGAGSGIGRAASLRLHEANFAVVLAGRRMERLIQTAALMSSGAPALPVPADVSHTGNVAALFSIVRESFGRVDVLFNNAGTGAPPVPFEELTFEQWSAVVEANLNGSFLCAREAFRLMKEQRPRGGRIINNGSLSAHSPRPRSAPYTATKHAITGLTRSIALDGRPFDILCSQIDVGNAATEMTAGMAQGALQADGRMAPEPRIDPDHIAKAVLFMATLPLDVNVPFLTIMANGMPFYGRG